MEFGQNSMVSFELISICLSAFIAVFFILSLLAIFMRLITGFFSVKDIEDDSHLIAALSTTINHHYPGTKIAKIEEVK